MLKRKINSYIKKYYVRTRNALLITGARQTGKMYVPLPLFLNHLNVIRFERVFIVLSGVCTQHRECFQST